jgi:ADP-ribose pyrophosphatase YjhB (NUDIX family)
MVLVMNAQVPSDTPIAYEDIEGIFGVEETVWENRFIRIMLVPSVFGPHISIRNPSGTSLVGVFVLVSDGAQILLVRQNRWASGMLTWELPAGGLGARETPAGGAARELLEETSVVIAEADLIELGTSNPNGSRLDALDHLFFARVSASDVAAADPDEIAETAWFPTDAVVTACLRGDIAAGTTVVGILRARILGLI